MGLAPIHLLNLLITDPALDQCDGGKQGAHDRCRWRSCHTCVPRHLLGMGVQREARNEQSCQSRQSSVFPLAGCAINLRFLT